MFRFYGEEVESRSWGVIWCDIEANSGARWGGDQGPTQEARIPAVDAVSRGPTLGGNCEVSKDDVPPIGLRYHRPP